LSQPHCWSATGRKRRNRDKEKDMDATDDVFEDPDEIWSSKEFLARVCSVVDDFQKATVFLRSSSKCKELLNKIQLLQSIQNLAGWVSK
jgi:hypothetical protein